MQEETPEQCAQFHADNRTERMERAFAALSALPADEADVVIATRIEQEDRTVACVACEELADELEVDAAGVCFHCRADVLTFNPQMPDTWAEAAMDLAA